jgi:hypothetical protein
MKGHSTSASLPLAGIPSASSPWTLSRDVQRDSNMSEMSMAEPSEVGPVRSSAEEAVQAERFISKHQSREVFGDPKSSSLAKIEDAAHERMQMSQKTPWLILLPTSRFRLVWDVTTCLLSAWRTAQPPAHLASSLRTTHPHPMCARVPPANQSRSLPSLCRIGLRSSTVGA